MLNALLVAPDPALFYRRDDPYDLRLGELVTIGVEGYANADIVLIGCPQDEGVRRNHGRPGAAAAPNIIRRYLMRLSVAGIDQLQIVDLGNLLVEGSLEEIHARLRRVVRRVASDGKRLVVLGGGNDISYGSCAGLSDALEPPLAVNIDAHYDVRADTPCNSGTPYRQLLEEALVRPEAFYEIGAQPFANSAVYTTYLRERGVTVVTLDELRAGGIDATIQAILRHRPEPAIFWGLDLDVVTAADAPGVSAPNPIGMSGAELCRIAALAGADPRSRLLEISEVNPSYDIDDRTSRLAAVVIWHFLAGLAHDRAGEEKRGQ